MKFLLSLSRRRRRTHGSFIDDRWMLCRGIANGPWEDSELKLHGVLGVMDSLIYSAVDLSKCWHEIKIDDL